MHSNFARNTAWLALALNALLALYTCGGEGPVSEIIGPGGGDLQAGGLTLAVPAGALTTPTTLSVDALTGGAPSGFDACSGVYMLSPDSLAFNVPATLSITGAECPGNATIIHCNSAGSACETLDSSKSGGTWNVELSTFGGIVFVGVEGDDDASDSDGTVAVGTAGAGGSGGGTAGSGGSGGVVNGFSFTVSPTSTSVARAGSVNVTINVTRTGSFVGDVNIQASGLPYSVSANILTIDSSATSGMFTFSAASDATIGTSNVTLTATGGTITHQSTVMLQVTEQSDFTIQETSLSPLYTIGYDYTLQMHIVRTGGHNLPVNCSVSEAITYFSVDNFTISSGSVLGNTTARPAVGATAGSYNATLNCNDGSIFRSIPYEPTLQ